MKFSLLLTFFAATMMPISSMATDDDSFLGSDWSGSSFLDTLGPVNATAECNTSMLQTFGDETFRSISQEALPLFFELEFKWKLSKVLTRELALREPESDEPAAFDGSFQVTGKKLLKILGDLKKFWDTSADDEVVLRSLNANLLADAQGLKQAYMTVKGWDPARAEAAATRIQEIVAMFPELGPSLPLWTLNAFAWFPVEGKTNGRGIAVGDGVMAFFEWLGIDETAPEFIVAHEYGHHLQYSLTNGPVVDERTPERTRYLEMEADALAAYYMHHPRGASRQNWKIMQAIEAAAAGGDCRFTSNGHHGTPAQRLDSAEFAIQVIDGSKGKGHKSSVAEFRDLFHTVFDQLVAANVN